MTESLLAVIGGIMGILFGAASLYLVKNFGPERHPASS
jgi:hypothetical protein